MALMYGNHFGELIAGQRVFVVTGIPVLATIPVGFAMVPAAVIEQKVRGTYGYGWSLPVPRSASAAATATVFTVVAVPGSVVSIIAAAVFYRFDLEPLAVAPAPLLTAAMSTSVGYAIGHVVPVPTVLTLITNLVTFLALRFSPIVLPIGQLPGLVGLGAAGPSPVADVRGGARRSHRGICRHAGRGLVPRPAVVDHRRLGGRWVDRGQTAMTNASSLPRTPAIVRASNVRKRPKGRAHRARATGGG